MPLPAGLNANVQAKTAHPAGAGADAVIALAVLTQQALYHLEQVVEQEGSIGGPHPSALQTAADTSY